MYFPSNMPTPKAGQAMTNKPQFKQYQQPDQGQTEQLAQGQVNQTLQQGGSLSPAVVAQLKARSKQSALSMAEQQKANAQAALAQRGFSAGGGMRQGADAMIDTGAINQILAQNRDTDITAATQNRADILNAVQSATDFMNARQSRSSDGYRNVLAGQGAQADSDFRVDGFNEAQRTGDNDFGLKQWVAQQQANQAADDSRLREASFEHGVGMDLSQFGETQRQFNNTLGFNYTQANNQQNNSLLSYLSSIFG